MAVRFAICPECSRELPVAAFGISLVNSKHRRNRNCAQCRSAIAARRDARTAEKKRDHEEARRAERAAASHREQQLEQLRKKTRKAARAADGYVAAHASEHASLPYMARNAILAELGFASYADYLRSRLWISIRRRVLGGGKACQLCGERATQVHHSRYTIGNLRGTSTRYLFPVCGDCHAAAERHTNGRKRSLPEANAALRTLTPAEIRAYAKM